MKKILFVVLISVFVLTGCTGNQPEEEQLPPKKEKQLQIIDPDSTSRPYAVVINNSTVAVKVQTSLQDAYLVYEFPVEGGLTRLMALYQDIPDTKIGTIRSARHNFLDYALEHDAIFVCYGWSHYAEDDMKANLVDYINGVVHPGPFWRENPENLAVEHTAYTNGSKIKEFIDTKGIRTSTKKGLVLDYSIDALNLNEKNGQQKANTITIPAGAETTKYLYDESAENYKRYVNGKEHIDYETKKQYTAKNIIIQKINTKMAADNYYWDLETVGSGRGFYITNGYAVPITWSKESREEKTKYRYEDGTPILLNDGNTYIQLQSNNQKLTIE